MQAFIIGFGIILVAAGIYHFVNPAFYDPIMPGWFPKRLANAAGGVAEIIIGAGMLFPDTRVVATWAAMALMVVFLPLHVWDLTKPRPAIGNHYVAFVRLVLQLVFIYLLYRGARGAS
ncbi:DoxX family protein [Neolewinella antarctica]|uniref:Membrane protein n=1 Tax=Neolewinella antarctica TaxID=442734 RepID=A0ABX0X702_9BACT|nr:hypothetical protein [Neolewinella antarctica]NJC25014.1 putative membrane protein [Neolewinella antarctica]